ncbi:putative Kynurenine--oxoglutarate transaminase 3-like protein, partial [Naja naja]|jgi:hypothetical protein
MLAFG